MNTESRQAGFGSSFETEIEEVRRLDSLRKRVRDIRQEGVEGLLKELNHSKKSPDWCAPGDNIENALLIRSLRKNRDFIKKNRKKILKKIEEIDIKSLFTRKDFFVPKHDHVPVLKAASVLSALSSIPGHAASEVSIRSFFRILYELNRTTRPEEMMGGASAGGAGVPKTAFITWSCVKAILSLADSFNKTAMVVNQLIELDQERPSSVAEEWWKVHIDYIRTSTLITLALYKDDIIFELEDSLFEIKRGNKVRTKAIYKTLKKELYKAKSSAELIKAEIKGKKNLGEEKVDDFAINEAMKGLKILAELSQLDDTKPAIIAEELLKITKEIKNTLKPTEKYFISILDRELADAIVHPHRICDAAELLFAADGLGHLIGWNDKRVVSALDKALPLLTDNGRVPSHRPFDVADKGYVLHVAGTEVITVLSSVIRNTEAPVGHEIIHKLIRHFTDTWRDDANGWRHERDDVKGTCSRWISALSIETLENIIHMIDSRINQIVLGYLSVKRPDELILDLKELFYSDYGMVVAGLKENSLAIEMQRMRAHVRGVEPPYSLGKLYSVLFYGPPGTGKTTLAEALAKSEKLPLVEITPSDILLAGAEKLETRAKIIFEGLSLLSNVVILFDDFDPIIWRREIQESVYNVFQFLTPGMLPKLKSLYGHSKDQRTAYVLSTNIIGGLDEAAIREGRFDEKFGVYPPDALSRVGRLHLALDQSGIILKNKNKGNADEVIKKSAGLAMNRLGKPGWFTKTKRFVARSPFFYIEQWNNPNNKIIWPPPEVSLPECPYGFKDRWRRDEKNIGKMPLEYAIREWLEWKWIVSLDQFTNERGVNKITKFIKGWKRRMGKIDLLGWEKDEFAVLKACYEKIEAAFKPARS
jgi:hypothetical protein